MNPIIGILGGLGAAFGWGISDFLAIRTSIAHTPIKTAFLSQLLGMFLAVGLVLISGSSFSGAHWAILGALGVAVLYGLALTAFYTALTIGPITVVSPVGNSYPLVTVLISVGLLGERPSSLQLIGISLIIGGVLASSIERDSDGGITRSKGVLFAGIGAILWGIAFSLNGSLIAALGWERYTFYQGLGLSIFLGLIALVAGKGKLGLKSLSNKSIMLVAIMEFVGTVAFNVGRSHSLAAIITPVSALLVPVTILLAVIFLHEKPTKVQLAGAAVVMAGLAILSV